LVAMADQENPAVPVQDHGLCAHRHPVRSALQGADLPLLVLAEHAIGSRVDHGFGASLEASIVGATIASALWSRRSWQLQAWGSRCQLDGPPQRLPNRLDSASAGWHPLHNVIVGIATDCGRGASSDLYDFSDRTSTY
jgi:hypothetical protein